MFHVLTAIDKLEIYVPIGKVWQDLIIQEGLGDVAGATLERGEQDNTGHPHDGDIPIPCALLEGVLQQSIHHHLNQYDPDPVACSRGLLGQLTLLQGRFGSVVTREV